MKEIDDEILMRHTIPHPRSSTRVKCAQGTKSFIVPYEKHMIMSMVNQTNCRELQLNENTQKTFLNCMAFLLVHNNFPTCCSRKKRPSKGTKTCFWAIIPAFSIQRLALSVFHRIAMSNIPDAHHIDDWWNPHSYDQCFVERTVNIREGSTECNVQTR